MYNLNGGEKMIGKYLSDTEIENIQEKEIKIKLPNSDWECFSEFCIMQGLIEGEVFEQFIRGWHELYSHRCSNETLLRYLLHHEHIIVNFLDLVDVVEESKGTLEDADKDKPNKYDKEDIEFLKAGKWYKEINEFINSENITGEQSK